MPHKYDFEFWKAFYEEDPEGAEAYRRIVIEQEITEVSHEKQANLRQLQWKIDGVRLRAKTPLGATVEISSLMQEQFSQLRITLPQLVDSLKLLSQTCDRVTGKGVGDASASDEMPMRHLTIVPSIKS